MIFKKTDLTFEIGVVKKTSVACPVVVFVLLTFFPFRLNFLGKLLAVVMGALR